MTLTLSSWISFAIPALFAIAYVFVFAEEKVRLRKSKPVMVAAGLIWILIAIAFHEQGRGAEVAEKLRDVLLEYAELFLFLLSAMSFINTMVERNVFEALRVRLVRKTFSFRGIFWSTGICAFFLSPFADNLTTALVMGTVVLTTLNYERRALPAALVNIVVAANAGGVFSPFGDITTLMIWQSGKIEFMQFFALFIPSLVNWLVPAAIISFMLPDQQLTCDAQESQVRKGGYAIVGIFCFTIIMTVALKHFLDLPPFLGMMMGLGMLNLYGYFLNGSETRTLAKTSIVTSPGSNASWPLRKPFDIFGILEKVEWDTLLFFYGVMLCVGGLGAIGHLDILSHYLYAGLGGTKANILIGALSSVIDNIPLVYAVLSMNPAMDLGQWLLITLTAGVGGSLLSIGSAAGVALMGIGRDKYTFLSHLKWTWAVLLGFAASIAVHLAMNQNFFSN